MSRITDIKPKSSKSRRYHIFVDGELVTEVNEEVIAKLDLRRNQAITPQRLEQIATAQQDSQTRQAALNLLNYRARTRQELVRRLRRKNLPADSIQRVIADLADKGLVDDRQFAKWMVGSLTHRNDLSKRAIADRLRHAGVDRQIAETVISEELADYDERSRAQQAAAKHMKKLANLEPTVLRRRLYSYLQRRGFSPHLIRDILQEIQPDDDPSAP